MPPNDSPNTGTLTGTGAGQETSHNTGDGGMSTGSTSATTTGSAFGQDFGQSGEEWRGDDRGRDLRDQASEIKEQARHAARETYEQVRQYTNESLEKARQQWNESRGRITERAQSVIQQQKDRLCTGMDDAAQAARAAAQELEQRNDASVANYARMAAGGLEQLRDYLRAADVRDMGDDVRRFTRRHPEWVLGGMFVVGLAVARFMKADRPIGPRDHLPEGADESLYRDVYRSQLEGGFGEDDAYGDFGEAGFGSYRADDYGSGTYGRPGQTAGYNPSGGAGAGYGQSYGTSAGQSRDAGTGTGFAGGSSSLGDAMAGDQDDEKGASI